MRLASLFFSLVAACFGQHIFFTGAFDSAKVETPVFSLVQGGYLGTQSVTLTTPTPGAVICFTVDGSTPMANNSGGCTAGAQYSSAITVSSTQTIKAIGAKNGFLLSDIASAYYQITAVYQDTFAGTAGTLLATHDPAWTSLSGSYVVGNCVLFDSGHVSTRVGWAYCGAYYSSSTSDVSEIVIPANATAALQTTFVCVRCSATSRGYSIRFSSASGGNWTGATFGKDSAYFGGTNVFSYPQNASHTLRIAASATNPTTVTISAYVDGDLIGTKADSSSPLPPASPGFWIPGNGTTYQSAVAGLWKDH